MAVNVGRRSPTSSVGTRVGLEEIIGDILADRFAPDARDTKEGPLVLADISGYTSWVARTELEHSRRAVALLLEAMIEALRGRLEAGQVAGDAVLFVGEGLDPSFTSWLDDAYLGFHRTVRELGSDNSCGCRACELVPTLTMKALAHYGRYNVLRVGPSQQVHGADVILPHRLAKNSVPSREYVLATPALADRLSEKDRARFTWRDEDAGEFGTLRVGYYDLREQTSRQSGG
jgi:class 3 adenylate cyclase